MKRTPSAPGASGRPWSSRSIGITVRSAAGIESAGFSFRCTTAGEARRVARET
jgi:hypothetical protein